MNAYGNCTQTVVSSTSSLFEVRLECPDDGMNLSGTIRFEVLSPESMKGSIQMDGNGGGHSMKVRTNMTAKWLGPVCGKSD